MGIYVKGMEMPESCYKCKLDLRTDACPAFDEWHKEHPYSIRAKDRLPDCPLVEVQEPHGNLIDRDILEQELINGIKAGNFEEGYEHYANINNMDDCVECVRYADTVIEAEGE